VSLKASGHQLHITFNPNAGAAGHNGENLTPGTGAWPDRAMNGDEPKRIMLTWAGDVAASERDVLLENMTLRAALMAPNTVIGFYVQNGGSMLINYTGVAATDGSGTKAFMIGPAEVRGPDD
jgi:hypothetical protein